MQPVQAKEEKKPAVGAKDAAGTAAGNTTAEPVQEAAAIASYSASRASDKVGHPSPGMWRAV